MNSFSTIRTIMNNKTGTEMFTKGTVIPLLSCSVCVCSALTGSRQRLLTQRSGGGGMVSRGGGGQ